MKRLFSLLLGGILTLTCVSCAPKEETGLDGPVTSEAALARAHVFTGMVLESSDGSLLVKPVSGSSEARSASRISVGLAEGALVDASGKTASPEAVQIGQLVEITYDGFIAESFPAQLSASRVELADVVYDVAPDDLEDGKSPFYDLPVLQAEYKTAEVVSCTNIMRGGASWFFNGTGLEADSIHPLDWEKEQLRTIQTEKGFDTVTLLFSSLPDGREPDSVTLTRWPVGTKRGDAETGEAVSLDGFSFTHCGGAYLYMVTAAWNEIGHVDWAFIVQ